MSLPQSARDIRKPSLTGTCVGRRGLSRRARSQRAPPQSLNAFNLLLPERALERAAAVDAARGCRTAARPAGRRAGGAQGQHLRARGRARRPRRGSSNSSIRPTTRRSCSGWKRRRGYHRQDQLRRVRDGIVERELGVRTGTESVGADSHAGRIERRIGGGGRRRAALRSRSAPIPAGRSASRRRSAASSG